MKISLFRLNRILFLALLFVLLGATTVLAEEANEEYITTDRVNFRGSASVQGNIISTLDSNTTVLVAEYDVAGWSSITYNGYKGFIKSEFLKKYDATKSNKNTSELLDWQQVKSIFITGVNAEVYDIRTGLTYNVRSFSNGNHADVETVTKEDTAIMLKTYNGKWAWDPRPVLVTINGKTMVGSINGMPHGGGVNANNGMDGQVCIHFRGSKTHNGNKAFERDHQDAITEGWNKVK